MILTAVPWISRDGFLFADENILFERVQE